MEKRYTLSECYELLDINPKTFRKWLDQAELKDQVMKNQVSKSDERVKYLTQKQLEQLAKDHERPLAVQTPQEPIFGSYKLLMDRFDELQALVLVIQKENQAAHLEREKQNTDLLQLQNAYADLADQVNSLRTHHEHTIEIVELTQNVLKHQQHIHEQDVQQLKASMTADLATITATFTGEIQKQYDLITTTSGQFTTQHQEHVGKIQLLQSGIQEILTNHTALAEQVEHVSTVLSENQQDYAALVALVDERQNAISEQLAQQARAHDKSITGVRTTLDELRHDISNQIQTLDKDLAKDVANLSEQFATNNQNLDRHIDHQRQVSSAQQLTINQLLQDLDQERKAREDMAAALSKQVALLAAAKPPTRQPRKAATAKKPE